MKRLCFAFLLLFSLSVWGDDSVPTTVITIKPGITIRAELAYTDQMRALGLMYRTSLSPDAGMLFLFADLDQHDFWMKNTLIPLDMIWLNERKEVVYIVTAVPCKADPCPSYIPMQKSQYVLEVNSGFAAKHHLKIGGKLEFTIPPEIERAVSSQ